MKKIINHTAAKLSTKISAILLIFSIFPQSLATRQAVFILIIVINVFAYTYVFIDLKRKK